MEAEALFIKIRTKILKIHEGTSVGKMMSAPAIKWNNKVFAFYHNGEMGFKLGEHFKADEMGLEWRLLSPFKTKAPLKAWFLIPAVQAKHWEQLAELALEYLKHN